MTNRATTVLLGLGLALLGCGESSAPEAGAAASSDPPKQTATGSEATHSADRLHQVLEEPDSFTRAARLAETLPTLGEEVIPALEDLLDRFRPQIGSVEFDLMLRRWAQLQPEEAAHWAVELSPRLYRSTAIRTAIEVLARTDPSKAIPLAGAAYLKGADEGTVAQFALIDGWFALDRSEALEYVEDLVKPVERQRALSAYVTVLAAADGAQAAIDWVESLSDEERRFKQEAYQQLIGALVWVDPAAALRFCEDHCDGPYASGLRTTVVRKQLQEGEAGEDIIEWVVRTAKTDTEQQREQRDKTVRTAWGHWKYGDEEAALAWLKDQLAEPEHEPWLKALYNDYARNLAAEDPALAIEWAQKVEDEKLRELTMVRIARYWLTQDEEAAEAWLAQSPLDPEQRKQARNPRLPHYLPGVGPLSPPPPPSAATASPTR